MLCIIGHTPVQTSSSLCAGHMLAVTTRPLDQELRHQTILYSCMNCSILDILPATRSCLRAGLPAETEPTSKAKVAMTANQPVAVRHAYGISIFDVEVPLHITDTFPHATPAVSRSLLIPAAMQIAAMAWNPLIAGELLYVCGDLSLYSLQLASDGRSQKQASTLQPGSSARGESGDLHGPVAPPQPRKVVAGFPERQMVETHPVALTVLAHPRRVYVASESSIYVADVRSLATNYRAV